MGWRSALGPGTPSSGCGTRERRRQSDMRTVSSRDNIEQDLSDLQTISENENDGECMSSS